MTVVEEVSITFPVCSQVNVKQDIISLSKLYIMKEYNWCGRKYPCILNI
jgi:hypothetical protein